MSKEDLIKKFNMIDYNNELEKILETKPFSGDTKNLLLSMLYKIENAYKDYRQVKQEVVSKSDFIEEILEIIKQVKEIRIAQPRTEEIKLLEEKQVKFIIDKEKETILVLPNEKSLLYSLYKITNQEKCIQEEDTILSVPFCEFLDIGNNMNQSEIIRDFNGWTWEIAETEIESIEYNLAFQNLIYLFGKEFLQEWIHESGEKKVLLKEFESILWQKYGEEKRKLLLKNLYQVILLTYYHIHEEEKQKLLDYQEQKEESLKKLENKKVFLQEITDQKKNLTEQIKRIDIILNDRELMIKEYKQRNSKLANKDKIFSISHLNDLLEKERQEALRKISEYNKLLDPLQYVHQKEELYQQVEFLKEMKLETKIEISPFLINLQRCFLACFKLEIEKIDNKKDVLKYLSIFRYYHFLPCGRNKKIFEVEELKLQLGEILTLLLQKAFLYEVVEKFSKEDKQNEEILKQLFLTKIIDMENIYFRIRKKEEKFVLEIYDTNILENEISLEENFTKEDLLVKLNKNIKVIKK